MPVHNSDKNSFRMIADGLTIFVSFKLTINWNICERLHNDVSQGVHDIEDITRWLEDMNFKFSWQEQLFLLFLPREHKIHIFEPPCNVPFIIWRLNKRDARNQFNKSKRRESWRHWTIRHSQRWHTENTPLESRMKWRMESTSGLVPSKTLFSI